MNSLLKICAGLIIIVVQSLLGARAFFPEAFDNAEDPLREMLAIKSSVLDQAPPEDLAAITHMPQVTVGVDPNFYPIEMFDERGRYTGLGGDYLRLLAKMTGLDFKPMAMADWAATEEKARQGKVDMFMAAAKTGRRSEFMLFTPPYITMPGVIMTKRGSGLDKADINKMAGKKIAVTKDYSWHDYLKEFHPEIVAVPAANTLEALQKVVTGEADAILDYEFNLLEKIQTAGILQMQTAGKVDSVYGHSIAINKNMPELFNVVSLALDQISPKEKKLLAEKWLEKEKARPDEKRLEWIFFFFVESILVCLAIIWYMDSQTKLEVKKALRKQQGAA